MTFSGAPEPTKKPKLAGLASTILSMRVIKMTDLFCGMCVCAARRFTCMNTTLTWSTDSIMVNTPGSMLVVPNLHTLI